jgi:hypothetical protein
MNGYLSQARKVLLSGQERREHAEQVFGEVNAR